MLRLLSTSLLLACGLAACGGATSPPIEDTQADEYAVSRARTPKKAAPVCAATGVGCGTDTDCCAGTCDWDSYGPTPKHCRAPQANGEYCSSDRGCTSGRCDQYECKAPTPVGGTLGSACKTSADCCSSTFCDSNTYGPFKCTAKRPLGEWCYDANECQSGSCVSYVCK